MRLRVACDVTYIALQLISSATVAEVAFFEFGNFKIISY